MYHFLHSVAPNLWKRRQYTVSFLNASSSYFYSCVRSNKWSNVEIRGRRRKRNSGYIKNGKSTSTLNVANDFLKGKKTIQVCEIYNVFLCGFLFRNEEKRKKTLSRKVESIISQWIAWTVYLGMYAKDKKRIEEVWDRTSEWESKWASQQENWLGKANVGKARNEWKEGRQNLYKWITISQVVLAVIFFEVKNY